MKKILLMLSCCIGIAYAQNGLFVQPSIGIGTANAHLKMDDVGPWGASNLSASSFFTYEAGCGIGYRIRNWQITSGLYLLKAGFVADYGVGEVMLVPVHEVDHDYQAMLPLTLGYCFKAGKHFEIVPAVGGAVSYNVEVDETQQENGQTAKQKFTGASFMEYYVRNSFWGIVQANATYKVNDKLKVFAGPEMQTMFSSLSRITNSNNYQRNYVYSLNLGVQLSIKKSSATSTIQ